MTWDELNQSSDQAFERGNYLKAMQLLNQAVPEAEKDPAKLALTLYRLGKVCLHLEENDRAEAVLTRALAISGKVMGLEHQDVARIIDQLGTAYVNQNKFAEAEPLLHRGLEMRRKLLGPQHLEIADSLTSLGALYVRKKDYAQAELHLREALEMQTQLLGADRQVSAETLGLLALSFYKQNVFNEAIRFAEHAMAIRQKALGETHPDVAMSLHIIAMAKIAQKDIAGGLEAYDQVLAIRLRHYPPEHSLVISVMKSIAMVHMRSRNFIQAQTIFEDMEHMTETAGKPEDHMFAVKQVAWLYVMQRSFDSGQVYINNTLRRLQPLGKSAERTRDNLRVALFCCNVGQKDYVSALCALPAAAQVLARNRTSDKKLFKQGFRAGLFAGKRN